MYACVCVCIHTHIHTYTLEGDHLKAEGQQDGLARKGAKVLVARLDSLSPGLASLIPEPTCWKESTDSYKVLSNCRVCSGVVFTLAVCLFQ